MLNPLGNSNLVLIFLIFMELLLIIIPVAIIFLREKVPISDQLRSIGFDFSRYTYKKVIGCICEGILVAILFVLIAELLVHISFGIVSSIFGDAYVQEAVTYAIDVEPSAPNTLELTVIILLQFLIVAPCEEAFFRGFVFEKLRIKFKYLYSLVISSSIFSLYHVPPFIVSMSTIILFFGYFFTFGILLAILYSLNRGLLLPCIIAHSIFNMIVLIT